MPRHSEETRKALEIEYLLAAEVLVAARGWNAGTLREVGKLVGKSRAPIHEKFKGPELRKALIREAYLHLITALDWNEQPPETFLDVLKTVVLYLREERTAAPLMVQVAALSAALDAPDAGEFQWAISRAWVSTTKALEKRLDQLLGERQRGRELRAEAVVDWYVNVCMTLVMRRSTSNPDLIRLAEGFGVLRDSCHDCARPSR